MADIIISAVPSSSFKVPELEVKKGVGLINVSSEHNFTQTTIDKAGWYVPRVGAVTRWCLILNALLSRLSTQGTRDKGELGLKERIGYD
jgi:methylenetetrahydrofolate dehydrogenase (NAD+)